MAQTKQIDFKRYINILIFSLSLLPLILFFYVVWNRIALPFVFDWGESAGLNQISRILSRNDLYVEPTLEFSPLVYTPFYYYLSAGFALLINDTLLAGRIISVLALIACAGMIGSLIHKETENVLLSWISAMSFVACFSLSDGFYDLLRVDSLYVFLVLIAFSVMRWANRRLSYLFAGILIAAGFFTKQSFIIALFPLIIYLIIARGKVAWWMVAAGLTAVIIPLVLINYGSDQWFLYYIFDLPREHGYSLISALNFWVGDTFRPLGITIAFNVVYLMAFIPTNGQGLSLGGINGEINDKNPSSEAKEVWRVYGLFIAGAAAAAWITRSSNGGGANNVMVFYAALAMGFGLGADMIINTHWAQKNDWNYGFIIILISIQFIGLVYNPFRFLPRQEEVIANASIINRIERSEKKILIPYRSHLAEKYGHGPQIHIVNLFELTGYFKGEVQAEGYLLVDQIRNNICWQEYGVIVLDQPVPWFDDQLALAYYLDEEIAEQDYQASELLAWRQGNQGVYLPRVDYDRDRCLQYSQPGEE